MMAARQASLHIPFVYTRFCEPQPEKRYQKTLFEQVPSNFWRPSDAGHFDKSAQIIDCLPSIRKACQEVNTLFSKESTANNAGKTSKDHKESPNKGNLCVILNETRVDEARFVVSLYTDNASLLAEQRGKLLRAYHPVDFQYIGIGISEVNNEGLKQYLQKLSALHNVAIYITNFLPVSVDVQDQGSSSARRKTDTGYILVYGDSCSCSHVILKIKLGIEQLLYGNCLDKLDLSFSLQPLVAGVRGGNLSTIAEQSGCRLYFPDQLPDLYATYEWNDNDPNMEKYRTLDEVYIVGPTVAHVELAKGMLQDVIDRTTPLLLQDCVVSFAKIDGIILHFQDEVKDIMYKHGSFIQLPFLGANRSLVRIMGVNTWSIERSIEGLMRLACEFYDISHMFHTGKRASDNDSKLERPILDIQLPTRKEVQSKVTMSNEPNYLPELYTINELFNRLEKVSQSTGVTLTNQDCTTYNIFGRIYEAKKATANLRSSPEFKNFSEQIIYQVELGAEHKDFVSGKKGGKLHKIMKNANVWIRFLPFNGHNLYISLEADSFISASSGIQLLEDELPAEISCYVPSLFHRQLIGTGGQKIQGLMRKYNVFIKFSNNQENYPNAYCLQEPDNVLIRCPNKNARNIPEAKQQLMKSVAEEALTLCNTFVYMTKSHRRILVTEKTLQLREVESKTNCIVLLPSDIINDADGLVEVQALGSNSQISARVLRTLLPEEYEFKIAYSRSFARATDLNSEFFDHIVVPLRLAFHMEVQAYMEPRDPSQGNYANTTPQSKVPGINTVPTTSNTATPPKMPRKYHRIVLSYLGEYVSDLDEAIQLVTSFLRRHDLSIIDRGEVQFDPIEDGTAATVGVQRKKEYFEGRDHFEYSENGPPPSALHMSAMDAAARPAGPEDPAYHGQGYYSSYNRAY